MISNQSRICENDTHNHHPSVSAKPSVLSVSSIDSDVSDRRDVREALYSGIFRRHRKTILVLGSFLKMLRRNVKKLHALNQIFAFIALRLDNVKLGPKFF